MNCGQQCTTDVVLRHPPVTRQRNDVVGTSGTVPYTSVWSEPVTDVLTTSVGPPLRRVRFHTGTSVLVGGR